MLAAAAGGASRVDLMLATDALLLALEVEGWMNWQPPVNQAKNQAPATLIALPLPDSQLPLPIAA